MTRSARAARASTTLPFPSSPQWPPTTAVTDITCSLASLRGAKRRSNLLRRGRLLRPFGPRSDSGFAQPLCHILDLACHVPLELPEPLAQIRIARSQHLHSQNGGGARTPRTARHGRHRHTRRHFHTAEQRVPPAQ